MNTDNRIWESLKEANISSLEELVDYLGTHLPYSLDEALIIPNQEPESIAAINRLPDPCRIVHRMPQSHIPLVLDEKLVESEEELTRYNGTPLYYVPFFVKERAALAAFTSREQMLGSFSNLSSKFDWLFGIFSDPPEVEDVPSCHNNPDDISEWVCLYEHIHFDGDVKCLAPGMAFPDLTRLGLTKIGVGIFSVYIGDWNDRISSVSACRYDVTLYEHIHYGGSLFYIPGGCSYPNLVNFGWNDRASSIKNWGRRY